jgi:hypothetical protein
MKGYISRGLRALYYSVMSKNGLPKWGINTINFSGQLKVIQHNLSEYDELIKEAL